MFHVRVLVFVLCVLAQGCATLKQEAGYGITPAPLCEVQKNWQSQATTTNFIVAAKGKSSIVTVRLLPEWAIMNGIGFTTQDEKGERKNIAVRLVWEAVFFPVTGGYQVFHGYPSSDMKYLNIIIPGKTKDYFKNGNWLFPSGSYRSAMTANGTKSQVVPVKLSKEDGCFQAFNAAQFFKEHPSHTVSVRDTVSDEDAVRFILVKMGEQFAQDFTIEDKKWFTSSQEDVVRAAGVTNNAGSLDYALSHQGVPIHPLAFMNPISAGLQIIPVALFLEKVFRDQDDRSLRGSFPEASFTREELAVFMKPVLAENQNEAAMALLRGKALAEENMKLRKEIEELKKSKNIN